MQPVTLRPIEMRDWQRIHEWAATEAACRFQPWGPNSPADSEQFVADALVAWQQEPIRRRVWAAEADGPGLVGLGELVVNSAKHRQGEIGYAVHLDWWGRGYGEAIARALLHRGFGELGLHRITATCDPRNVASDRVLQKVGMVHEGTLRGTHLLRDGWRDSNLYALVADAWSSMCLPSIAVDQCTQLVPPTIECLLGLTAIADEVSERWITPRRDREVMQRWLGRIIERNNEGQIARFCIHREAHCAGVVGFSSLDPVRMSWWVGPQWRGTGLAEVSCRAALASLGTTQEVTAVEAIVDPDNHASMALAKRLGFRDAGSITKHRTDTGDSVQRRRLALEYQPPAQARPSSARLYADT